jgi:ribosomal protein L2
MSFYFFIKIGRHLRFGLNSLGGRNNLGRVCVSGRCKGNKRLLRRIDINRKLNKFGVLLKIIHDPRHTA